MILVWKNTGRNCKQLCCRKGVICLGRDHKQANFDKSKDVNKPKLDNNNVGINGKLTKYPQVISYKGY